MSVNREAKSGCINITQLLKFNSVKHTRKTEECTRLVKSQEQAVFMAFDQPIRGLAKEIQWRYADTMGEDKLVVMLGGLLIELAVLKAIGSWLLGSGWTEAIAQAEITTTGRAESLVTSTHITRTRYIHQVTASSTETLQGLLRKIRRERSSIPRMV